MSEEIDGRKNECRVFAVESWSLVGQFASRAEGVFSSDESIFAIESGPGEISLRYGERLEEFAKTFEFGRSILLATVFPA